MSAYELQVANESLQTRKESPHIYLGFDFGTQKIGVAVGQPITQTATPLPIVRAQKGVPNWQDVAVLIKKWKPEALIVGVPLKEKDEDGKVITKRARAFARALGEHFGLPVHVIDERLTTKAARDFICDNFGIKALQTAPVDSFAAKIILESWMHDVVTAQ